MDQFGLVLCLVSMADMHWTAAAEVGPRQAFDVAQGLWWRFDRYEVRDGCVRPTRGARLEQYDPWDQYRAARDGDTRVDPPYAALVALVGVLADDPETEVKKKAVFALSQLPKEEGVPMLIQVAKTNRNPEVRKQAMFWLGQSRDPRAVTFFEDILLKK